MSFEILEHFFEGNCQKFPSKAVAECRAILNVTTIITVQCLLSEDNFLFLCKLSTAKNKRFPNDFVREDFYSVSKTEFRTRSSEFANFPTLNFNVTLRITLRAWLWVRHALLYNYYRLLQFSSSRNKNKKLPAQLLFLV